MQLTSPYQRNYSGKVRPRSWQQQHSGSLEAQLSSYRGSLCRDDRPQLALSSRDQLFITWPTVKKQGIVSLRPSDFSEPCNYLAKRLGPLYKRTRDGGVLCEGCSDVKRCVFRVTVPSDGITPPPSCSSKNTMTIVADPVTSYQTARLSFTWGRQFTVFCQKVSLLFRSEDGRSRYLWTSVPGYQTLLRPEDGSNVRRCVFRVTVPSDGVTPPPSCSSKNTMAV